MVTEARFTWNLARSKDKDMVDGDRAVYEPTTFFNVLQILLECLNLFHIFCTLWAHYDNVCHTFFTLDSLCHTCSTFATLTYVLRDFLTIY